MNNVWFTMKQMKKSAGWLILLLVMGIACQLTSPTPASWSGTPTAQARAATNTALALTQQINTVESGETVLTPLPATIESKELSTSQPQPTPISANKGPWLVYPGADNGTLHAYDVAMQQTLDIHLPEPIFFTDLTRGNSPDGETLIIRAGSPLNIDELALYRIDLPSTEIKKISPLLSLSLQRKIANKEGSRAIETLQAVSRTDGLAWSPDGRFLAFTAALDNESSDLYVLDTLNDRIERLNGYYSHNATPFWSPGSNWLISQELEDYVPDLGWRAVNVTGMRVPGYDDQNTLYLPDETSRGEVFLGWVNVHNFISHSISVEGHKTLRQVNVNSKKATIVFPGPFDQAAFDPVSGTLAFSVDSKNGPLDGMMAGVYLLKPDSSSYSLVRAGEWQQISWISDGMFGAVSSQGVLVFSPESEGIFLPGEGDISPSPDGNWMVAWGDGAGSTAGARLYQPPSNRALQTLIGTPVESIAWEQDSNGFFLLGGGILYRLVFPGLNLEEIERGFPEKDSLDLIWLK